MDGSVFKARASGGNNFQGIDVDTVLPNEVPVQIPDSAPRQVLHMPPEILRTIKLRIVGDNAPEELDGIIIKIYVRISPHCFFKLRLVI